MLTLERIAAACLAAPAMREYIERELAKQGHTVAELEAEVPAFLALVREEPGAEEGILAVAEAIYGMDRSSKWRAA